MTESTQVGLTFLCAAGFAAIHLFAGKLRFLDAIPRSRWLSFAGGVSVAYVFVHLLPELRSEQQTLEEVTAGVLGFIEHHVYLIALLGLAAFYGLELAIKHARRQRPDVEGGTELRGVLWLHLGSFAVYNALIGYLLLHREETGLRGLIIYAVAMGLHFLTNDYGLRQDHKHFYRHTGRWLLAAAVLLGWLLGVTVAIHHGALAVLFGFLAGGVILNVLKEELPEERQSRFWPFILGAVGYAVLLLLI